MSATNTDRKARFEQHLVEILNFGAVNLAMGVGYRSGAFEAMDAIGRPATITEIADKSGLDGRYLKEWLGVMVSGGVIDLIDDGEDGERRRRTGNDVGTGEGRGDAGGGRFSIHRGK